MRTTPFNLLTFLLDRYHDSKLDFLGRSLTAATIALDQARAAGDAAQFERVAAHYRRCRADALALYPTANLPDVSLDFAPPALRRAA